MTTAAQNTLSIDGILTRSRTNGGTHTVALVRALTGLTDIRVIEKTVPQNNANVAIELDGMTAKAIVVLTPQNIGLIINGAGNVPCGSLHVTMDTAITTLAIDNTKVADKDCVVEIWAAQ